MCVPLESLATQRLIWGPATLHHLECVSNAASQASPQTWIGMLILFIFNSTTFLTVHIFHRRRNVAHDQVVWKTVKCRFVAVALLTPGAGFPRHQAEQLCLSKAPEQRQPRAHSPSLQGSGSSSSPSRGAPAGSSGAGAASGQERWASLGRRAEAWGPEEVGKHIHRSGGGGAYKVHFNKNPDNSKSQKSLRITALWFALRPLFFPLSLLK